MRYLPLAVFLFFSQSFGLAAQENRLLELADFYRVESVSDPAISPDGGRVAFVRTSVVEEENRRHREVWMVSADGGGAVRLTHPAFDSASPQWSPDGALLAFSSKRALPGEEDGHSVWFLRMDRPGGEAFRIEGVEGRPVFSPDNRWIAFTKPTPPDAPKPKEEYESEFERRIAERFEGRVYDWMNYRFDRRGYLPDPRDPYATPADELYVVPREGGEARRLTKLGFDVRGPAWSDDGRMLAFTADSHQRDEHSYERADLWTADLEGNVRRLTDDSRHYSAAAWSPDGKRIVARGYIGLDEIIESGQGRGSPTDLYEIPLDGGPVRNLTADWDLIPGAHSFTPDGEYLLFDAYVGGNRHLFRMPAGGGDVEQVTQGDRRLRDFSLSADGRRMAYQAENPLSPGDIYLAQADGGAERRLTEVNADLLGGLSLSSPERLLFESKDGTRIEGWIMPPVGLQEGAGPAPLILTIHGGPHGAYGNDFSFHRQLLAARGYFVLYINPRASIGYGEDFRWATWGGWGILDYQDLMAGVDYALERYPVDRQRMGVTGGSYGGFMTNWVIGHTDRFAAAVSRASISNWMSDYGVADIPRTKESEFFGPPWEKESRDRMIRLSPLTYAGNVSTPTLFLHGELDFRVPIEEAEQMYVALKKLGVPARFIRYPESYHGGWTPWRRVHALHSELEWWESWLREAEGETGGAR